MEVPIKYHAIYLTYPMADKMPINEKQLDLIILSMLKQLNQTYKVYGQRADGSIPPENKDYKMLAKYLTGKTIENIIQDVIQVKLLVPNLSRPATVRNIWEGIDQMLDDIDVIEPIMFENPASEIPDSKLIESGSDVQSVSSENAISVLPQISSNSMNSMILNDKPPSTVSNDNKLSVRNNSKGIAMQKVNGTKPTKNSKNSIINFTAKPSL